jgi:general secretion pathway protein J
MRRERARQDGFALIEAVAVLALSALVLLTLLIAADIVTRNAGAASRRTHEVEAVATGLAAVRRDLAGALFLRAGPEPDSPVLLEGTANAIGFAVAKDRTDLGYSGSLIRIEAQYGDGRGTLLRSSARLLPELTGFADATFGDAAVLLNGPWTYRFAYASAARGSLQWSEAWSNPGAIPAAVRLEVLDAEGKPMAPPLVARIGVDAELNCAESEFGCPEDNAGEFDEEENADADDGGEEDEVPF